MAENAGFLKGLFGRRQQVVQGPTQQDLSDLAASLGYKLMTTPDGRTIPVPADLSPAEVQSLNARWSSIENSSRDLINNRTTRLATYARMDRSGGPSAVVLDTLADEVVNITDYTESSLVIEISDKALEKKIFRVLKDNNVLSNIRSDIRSLCKHGDFAYVFGKPGRERLMDLDPSKEQSMWSGASALTVPYQPNDIVIAYASPEIYELESSTNRVYNLKIGPSADSALGFTWAEGDYKPWEFALFSINSRDTFPYGLSELEKMRVPFEKLAILEELLALTRQSRLDKIAVTVPGLKGDVTSVMNRLNMLKNSLKSMLLGFTGPGSRISRNQDTGLTEYLFVPENFKVEKLSTSLEVSTIEDVEYFRDQLINASRLPKGFFLASEGQGQQRPMSLRQQDIKFARSLIPIGEAYCYGLERLIVLTAFYLGSDVSKLNVKVNFKKSPYITTELTQTYKDTYEIIRTFKEIKGSFSQTAEITDVDIKRILDLVGVPHAIFFPEDEGKQRITDAKVASPALPQSLLERIGVYQNHTPRLYG